MICAPSLMQNLFIFRKKGKAWAIMNVLENLKFPPQP